MIATHNIQSVSFEQNQICLQIDGKSIKLPLAQVSKKLEAANEMERNLFTISPSGYGIHWPLIDEDLSVDSILKIV
ncbi:MAG: DUF2442 domain-containing protein [Ferruginibacter sp.]